MTGKKLFVAAAATLVVMMLAPPGMAQEDAAAASDRVSPLVESFLHWTTRGIEIAGIVAIVIGGIVATGRYLHELLGGNRTDAVFHTYRSRLGRSILLGLEFLVAADIISTVAIDPTLESVAVLAGVVLVRTFLSFALEVEIDGTWPWRKGRS